MKHFLSSLTLYKYLKERLLKSFATTRMDECREVRYTQSTGLPTEAMVTICVKKCDKGNNMVIYCAASAIAEWRLSLLQEEIRIAIANINVVAYWGEALEAADKVLRAVADDSDSMHDKEVVVNSQPLKCGRRRQ